jgi:hypothetical protein
MYVKISNSPIKEEQENYILQSNGEHEITPKKSGKERKRDR